MARLAEISKRLDTALSQLANASRAVADGVSRGDIGSDELARREEAVSDAEQDVRSVLDKRRLIADRILDRKRSIALLEGDISTRRPADALTLAGFQDRGRETGLSTGAMVSIISVNPVALRQDTPIAASA